MFSGWYGRLLRYATIMGMAAALTGCTQWQSLRPAWSSLSLSGSSEVGSDEWWNRNRSRAEFVPGSGYRVPGTDGFFDKNGRPISAPISPTLAENKKSLLGSFQPTQTYDRLMAAVGQGPDEAEAKRLFDEGRDLYQQKEYTAAAKRLASAASRAPRSALAQDALFLRAESLFFSDEYPEANEAYLKLIKDYPNTKYLDTAITRQASIARYWQQTYQQDPEWPVTPNLWDDTRPAFDTIGHAVRTYENIRLNDPTGPLADDALMATANAYFLRGRYDEADYHYELLRREYPKSDHQYEAHLLGLQCKLRKYQGPQYDATPLEEAERLIKQLRIQFAPELTQQERRRVDEIEARIQRNWAQRDWEMAQFYETRSQYGAARYYYAQIIDAYPQSEMAQQSRTRLAAIHDEPAVPPEKLGWLMQYLPESRDEARLAVPPQQSAVRR